jgi:type VI secretion system secreted protein Hcp
MAGYMKLKDIEGEGGEGGHKGWVLIESMSSPIYRSITEGAKDQERARGSTTAGDIVVVRKVDKSSPKLQNLCFTGKVNKEVLIDFCAEANNKEEPYMQWKLENVIVSSYSIHAHESGSPVPTEEVTMNYTKVEFKYIVLKKDTLEPAGNVVSTFDLSAKTS